MRAMLRWAVNTQEKKTESVSAMVLTTFTYRRVMNFDVRYAFKTISTPRIPVTVGWLHLQFWFLLWSLLLD